MSRHSHRLHTVPRAAPRRRLARRQPSFLAASSPATGLPPTPSARITIVTYYGVLVLTVFISPSPSSPTSPRTSRLYLAPPLCPHLVLSAMTCYAPHAAPALQALTPPVKGTPEIPPSPPTFRRPVKRLAPAPVSLAARSRQELPASPPSPNLKPGSNQTAVRTLRAR
jgi:hypothetical protein